METVALAMDIEEGSQSDELSQTLVAGSAARVLRVDVIPASPPCQSGKLSEPLVRRSGKKVRAQHQHAVTTAPRHDNHVHLVREEKKETRGWWRKAEEEGRDCVWEHRESRPTRKQGHSRSAAGYAQTVQDIARFKMLMRI
jgi:hypothetical protein